MLRFFIFSVLLSSLSVSAAARGESAPTAQSAVANGDSAIVAPSDPRIVIVGRWNVREPSLPRLGYPGTTIRFRFCGPFAAVRLSSDSENSFMMSIVDGGEPLVHALPKGSSEIVIAKGLDAGPHVAEIVKRTETWQGVVTFQGIRLAEGGALLEAPLASKRKLLFIGDSVTCGSSIDRSAPGCKDGMYRPSNGYGSYGMLLGRRLDAETHLLCFGGRGVVRDFRGKREVLNAPQFFTLAIPAEEPSGRAEWPMDRWVPDAVFISLGTNDFNLDKTDPIPHEEFVNTYVDFVRKVRRTYPNAFIFLTEGAIVKDEAEANPPRKPLTVLRSYVQETVEKVADPRVRWVESRHYPGEECDAHPTKAEHIRMAQDFEPLLREALGW